MFSAPSGLSDIPGGISFSLMQMDVSAGDDGISPHMAMSEAMTAMLNTPGTPVYASIQAQIKAARGERDEVDPTEEETASPFWKSLSKSIAQDNPDGTHAHMHGRYIKPEEVRPVLSCYYTLCYELTHPLSSELTKCTPNPLLV